MANTVIQLKKSSTPGSSPSSGNLANGELAINFADGVIYYKNLVGQVAQFIAPGRNFGTVNANGTLLVSAIAGDVFTILPGQNITVVGDAVNDRVTIGADLTSANGWANLVGSSANASSSANDATQGANIAVLAAAFVSNSQSLSANVNILAAAIGSGGLSNTSGVSFAGNLYFPTGNVGIGTATPSSRLEVIGNSYLNGAVTTGTLRHSPVPISRLLTAFDAADDDALCRLSLSDDASVLAVGASSWEGASGTDRGGVYIYDWNGSAWVQRGSVLEAPDAADNDRFGQSTSLSSDGSILAVGATLWEGTTGTNRGGVYIYDWNGSSWVQRGSVLEAADAADSDGFGQSVSLSSNGSILAVGAWTWEGTTGTNRGGVYIYDWNGSSWVQRGSVLEAADAADSDNFGIGVSLSSNGSILAVGAWTWEGATGTGRGGVYIYDWNGSSWVQRGSVLEAPDAADSDLFGVSVSINSDGSILAVGAATWEGSTGTDRGGVYIYDWNGSSWVQRGSVLEAVDAADIDQFSRVALSRDGSILVVGNISWEGTTGANRGAVYTYSLTGALPSYSGVATGSGWIEGSNSALIARTAGLDRVTIGSSGNVGIGTSTANAKLDISGSPTNTLRLSSSSDSANYYSEFINYYNSGKSFEITHGGVSFLRTAQQGYYNVEFGPAQYHWRTNYGDGYISANTNSAERMRITSTGRVGIGTIGPTARLHVTGAASTTALLIEGQGGANYYVDYLGTGANYSDATTHYFRGNAGNGTWMVLSNGNVGIGNTAPDAKLHVAGTTILGGDTVGTMDVKFSRLLSGTRVINHWFSHSANSPWYLFGQNMTWTGERTGTVDPTHAHRPYYEAYAPVVGYKEFGFANVSSGSIASSNLIANMVLTNTGNVGIGTASPSAKLHVSGGYTILADHNTQSVPTAALGATALSWNYSGGSAEINFWNLWTSAVGGGFRFSQKTGTSTFNDIYWAANTSHIWYTTGTERMRIDSSGQVGIGTSSPSATLHVQGNANIALPNLVVGGTNVIAAIVAANANAVTLSSNVNALAAAFVSNSQSLSANVNTLAGTFASANANTISLSANLNVLAAAVVANDASQGANIAVLAASFVSNSQTLSANVNTLAANVNTLAGAAYPKTGGTISGDVTVTGSLTVSGATTYVNTQTLLIGDNLVTLNADLPGNVQPTENAGLEINRGARTSNAAFIWNENANSWQFTSNTLAGVYSIIASQTDANNVGAAANNFAAATYLTQSAFASANANSVSQSANVNVLAAAFVSNSQSLSANVNTLAATFASANANSISLSANVNVLAAAVVANDASQGANIAVLAASFVSNSQSLSANVNTLAAALVSANTSAHADIDALSIVANTKLANTSGVSFNGNLFFPTGNVGIGVSSTVYKLQLQRTAGAATNGEIWSGDGTYWTQLNSRQSAGAYSPLVAAGDHALIYSDGTAETGAFVIGQWSSSAKGIRINASGDVGIGIAGPLYKLHVNGSFAANTKSFVIDHPTKPGMKLRYGSLEGPENGVYVRGKLDGIKVIELPDYWEGLVDLNTITVQLTAIGHAQNLYVAAIDGLKIHIDTENHTQPYCYYTVYGERKDVEKLVVEFEA